MQFNHLPGSLFGPPTLVDLLRHRAFHQGDELAFTYLKDGEADEIRVTFAELDAKARAIAGWLESLNLQGQRALLLYPAGVDFIYAFFGCLYAGVVAVPANPPRLNRSLLRLQAIASDSEAQVALTTETILDRVTPQLEQTPDLKKTLQWLATDSISEGFEKDWRDPGVRGDTLAFLQYTSGSTGAPKGVMLSHSNLLHNCALISYAFEHSRSGSGCFWLPNYHDMGLVGGILMPLFVGRPNVLMSPMSFLQRPYRWLQAISRYRVTISGGPNFAYDLCSRKITEEQRATLDLSCWSLAFNGAEPVRAETIDRFCETFASCGFRRDAFYPCYGLAEATLLVSGGLKAKAPIVRAFDAKALENEIVVPTEDAEGRRLVGSGHRLPDQKVEIVNPETRARCAPGEIGEIWVAGPSIAQGYWKRREETELTFRARIEGYGRTHFLRTGDLGFFHEEELFVAGRLKDLLIIRGLNHYPQDIELTVEHSHPAVRANSGAAFTVDVEGEARLVIVYEVERRNSPLDEVLNAIRESVSREHDLAVDAIVLIKAGSVPKTSSGKIQRHACRQAFINRDLVVVAEWSVKPRHVEHSVVGQNGAAASIASTNGAGVIDSHRSPLAVTRILDDVMTEVRRVAKERAADMTADTSIPSLGLDSLERMEVLNCLEDRFGGRFPEEILQDLDSCRDVAAAVEKHLGGRKNVAATSADIPLENYKFELYPEYLKLKQSMQAISDLGMKNPYFNVHEGVTDDTTRIDGREYINFSSYNYVGMSGDPRVAQAAKDAIDRFGTSVSASRLVSGEKTLHVQLERTIADFVGAEDSIVFVGGHSTNETTIGHLFGPGDLILHDALAHNSIVQGAILSGARRRPFPHNDWRAVDRLLDEMRGQYRRVLIAIEGVYSMDGDIPDLPQFIDVKRRHKAFLMVDEAHSIGVLGPHGRGIGEHFEVDPRDVDLWMGTLSKSFGSCGGYIAGNKAVVEYLKYSAPGFVYSVGLSPSNAAAALASIRLLEEEPERVTTVQKRARQFLELAKKHRLNTGMSMGSAVVPVILGNSLHCLQLARSLYRRGINVQPIMYPAVEERAARLRFFITSRHSEEQISYTVNCIGEELQKLSPKYTAALAPAAVPTPISVLNPAPR